MKLRKSYLLLKALPDILLYFFGMLILGAFYYAFISLDMLLNNIDKAYFIIIIAGLCIILGINLFSFVCLIVDIASSKTLTYTGFFDSSHNYIKKSYTLKFKQEGNELKLKSLVSYKKYKDKYVTVFYGELSKKIFKIELESRKNINVEKE